MHNPLRIAKVVTALLLVSGFAAICFSRLDPDLGWHLASGAWVFANRAVPPPDAYSYTMPGYEWVNHEWLMDAWLWWMHAHDAWIVVVLVFAAAISIPFLYWIRRAASHVDILLIMAAGIFFTGLAGVRPQIVSFLFFFVVYELLRRLYGAYTPLPRRAWLLLPLFFVWAHVHGGFIAGLGIWLGMLLVFLAVHRQKFQPPGVSRPWSDILLFVLSAALTFTTPYGISLYKEIYTASQSAETLRYITEWQPAFTTGSLSYVLFLAAGLTFFFYVEAWRWFMSLPLAAAVAATLAAFLRSVRNGPFFFVTAMPYMQTLVVKTGEKIMRERRGYPFSQNQKRAYAISLCLLYGSAFALFGYFSFVRAQPAYPDTAVSVLREYIKNSKNREPRVLNTYEWGGYLIHHAPEIPVFIDGRMPHWTAGGGTSAMKDYVTIFYEPGNAWRRVFQKWDISAVLIKNTDSKETHWEQLREKIIETSAGAWIKNTFAKEQEQNLAEKLTRHNWELLYEDNIARVLVCENNDCY